MKTRHFTWCPERAIPLCQTWWPVPHAHVVIRTPGASPKTPGCGAMPLHMEFVDLDPDGIRRTEAYRNNPGKGDLLIADCFQEHQAVTIADLVEGLPEDVLLVVNCEAGISRSAGVVLALRRHYGGDEQEIFDRAAPNIHVTSVLSRELRNRKIRALQQEQGSRKEDLIMENESREPGRSGRRFGDGGERGAAGMFHSADKPLGKDLAELKSKCERFEAALRDIAGREHSCVGVAGPCRCSICTAAEALKSEEA